MSKWEQDLTKDIRTGDLSFDDRDLPIDGSFEYDGWPEVTAADREALKEEFLKVRDNCRAILEIGISRELNGEENFTQIFLKNKKQETVYVGIDIDDKKYLNSVENNVHTIHAESSNYQGCTDYIKSIGVEQFDFIFIDGWHSINQVLDDWEYTNFLSKAGIVGLHDTNYHPGPKFFLDAIDTDKWHVVKNATNETKDWGIGFVRKK
jgi:hypothetical protein